MTQIRLVNDFNKSSINVTNTPLQAFEEKEFKHWFIEVTEV